ncbi:Rieske (2Fe-2S) protein [Micromonospora sp. NPDC007208]|uniref:Nitrite reductase/ring-hydroxylating ferredoxin subunit n=1 Tax=Micromonospora ureilytica TaxID=709868 RepID=A0A3N9Y234_9ACTN|nr:Rieske (2Fe-2S) protein [Micromonospora ureilytica]MBG6064226.1 nitrite reductase/ring-hydroxylating ferredoxin subunit [Micromonospora ureilytica]RQX19358.1 Rieske (2Fe-2S) protein [Micromonospora ureilytica]WSG33716.1 Rieske (2Fe-2S) protein [Micromonospora ureilytica]WSR56106.1 Rieske (2Fe-2S) protein [Micromonospora ureilytica]
MSDDQALTGPGTQTRRTLLTGVGAVGAAVVLAACGSDDGGSGSDAPTSGGPAVPSTGDAGGGDRQNAQSLATTADIPVGGGKVLAAEGVVITQPAAGQFKGFSPICTHQNCPVTNVDGGTINCTCHGSKFSIEDGSVKAGPATKPLPPKNIKVTGDQISLA